MPNQRKLEWTPWILGPHGGSRNLDRMGGGLDRMVKTLHVGNEDAIKAMSDLPITKHDLDAADKFILDSWPVGVGEDVRLFVTVHGQFEESRSDVLVITHSKFSDQNLTLCPTLQCPLMASGPLTVRLSSHRRRKGRSELYSVHLTFRSQLSLLDLLSNRAKQTGWDVMVLSDQLVVRGYSSHEVWRPGPMSVQGEHEFSSNGIPPVANIAPGVQAQLHHLVSSNISPERDD